MTERKFRLRNLMVNRVAFVDRGANPDADIVLYKRDGVEDVAKATKTEADGSHPASDYAYVPDPNKPSTWKLRIDTKQNVSGAAAAMGPGGFRGQPVQMPMADRAAVKNKIRAAWRKFNPDKADSEMPPSIAKQEGGHMGIDKEALDPEVREYVDGLEANLSEARGEIETVKADLAKVQSSVEKTEETEDIVKSLSPEAQEVLKAERDRSEALEKRVQDAEQAIEAARIEKADREFTEKAAAWKHLSLDPAVVGPMLRKVAEKDVDAEAEVERVLTSANAIASESLREIGKGGSGPTDAMGKIEAIAKARAQEKGIPVADAYAEVMETDEGRDLYTQHKQEVK